MADFQKRRFVFIDFENLKKVKFKKLEKVCDRVFIFIDAEEQSIPFVLVRQIQRLGKTVRWIPIHNPHQGDMNYHIAFLMGKFHQKINKQTEFAILSNDQGFDPLVSFVNGQGRSCLRVRSKPAKQETKSKQKYEIEDESFGKKSEDRPLFMDAAFNNGMVESTAQDTMLRLKRTKNRPSELNKLRNFIMLNNQEFSKRGNVDQIIHLLEAQKNIAIRGGRVTYHF